MLWPGVNESSAILFGDLYGDIFKMEEIILDKSYLDGATSQEINRLCKEYRVLMPDVLLYELTTTTETSRQRCFNKIPTTRKPVEIIPNVGTLLRYELNNLKPCTPLYGRREKIIKFGSPFIQHNSLERQVTKFLKSVPLQKSGENG